MKLVLDLKFGIPMHLVVTRRVLKPILCNQFMFQLAPIFSCTDENGPILSSKSNTMSVILVVHVQ